MMRLVPTVDGDRWADDRAEMQASMARHPSRFVPESVATCDLCGVAWDHTHDWAAELAYDPEVDGRYGPS